MFRRTSGPGSWKSVCSCQQPGGYWGSGPWSRWLRAWLSKPSPRAGSPPGSHSMSSGSGHWYLGLLQVCHNHYCVTMSRVPTNNSICQLLLVLSPSLHFLKSELVTRSGDIPGVNTHGHSTHCTDRILRLMSSSLWSVPGANVIKTTVQYSVTISPKDSWSKN